MEKKTRNEHRGENKAVWILKSLLCAYIVTGILLLLLTLLLYKVNLDEGKVTGGITAIYVISTFAGGFFAGKLAKVRKFIWGLTTGVLYFALLLLITLGIYHTIQGGGMGVLTTFLLCAGGGMLGGMVS
ncbi:TIGR04086 family membrane protein [Muricomes intestini]|uniref:Putative membrane protein (TIGR04086 family) n=1 Tax=Muricomes intestini TaxID=1796634 RepID=A0A4R3KC13_9FIRM|nr:TIGR04086 family membrane protein [Muricomes intestini]TCS80637.1 putative membrane protein (TIGR04086 family) [Muricomes intestini]HCR83130.1 TIGR04086 family membrane protein [Lachnospiraceae bacterium]